MSGYGYRYGEGYSGYNGGSPPKDDWSKTSYASDDHVHRPVVVDAEGKKRAIMSLGPIHRRTEGYVTKTEIVEHVHSPILPDYRHSSPTKVYPVKDYGVTEERWHRTSSPVHDRPHEVEEFITKVQTDASRPKFVHPAATHWRQNHNSAGNHGNNGHGEYNSMSNNEWHKPSGNNTIRKDNYDDYHHQNDSKTKPTMTTTGGWARPSHATWSSPPDAPLSKPTNNIDEAVEYLREAAKPFSSSTTNTTAPHSRYTRPNYSETIDSREAARRYGNFNLSSRSNSMNDPNKPIIDSREAMRKYRGTAV